MSFHPNEVQRRGRLAGLLVAGLLSIILAAFFRTQVIDHARYAMQSEDNRLNEVPMPAPRGAIFDRHGLVIAENIPGYSVAILSRGADSLRAQLRRLATVVSLSDSSIDQAVRRYRRDPARPTTIIADASFEEVSLLEEHRTQFPSLIIQSSPKRHYPDGEALSAFVGYTGEISEPELNSGKFPGYKPGQEIGKAGLEKEYESVLRGTEGSRFVEVDARGRVVREAGARPDLLPVPGKSLRTNIDLDLQRFVARYFADSGLVGAAVALDPATGAVLALHSAPGYDPNRFVGGVSSKYFEQLRTDPRRPLYNKAIQGTYPPASTFKLAIAVMAMQEKLATLDTHMPQACTGGYLFGSRYFRCWEKKGHGSLTLAQAIEKSCDVYFYQLGLRLTLTKLVAGGVSLKFLERSGIDLPNEQRPEFPYDANEYFNKKLGVGQWTNATTLNLSIGQGENAQTVINMARFYTALATDGIMSTPSVARAQQDSHKVISLDSADFRGIREALFGVISARGTAASAAVKGVEIAGKTGSAQAGGKLADHAWFVGFAPKEQPTIVVAVFLEFGLHGYLAARVASKVIEHYLKRPAIVPVNTNGG